MKPGFFIVGAPKCGTTALSKYLSEHARVAFSNPKEPNYLCTDFPSKVKIKDQAHYAEIFQFDGVGAPQAVGEASVWYLYSAAALKRLSEDFKDSKIIVMIRNPIDFCFSLHNQLCIGGYEKDKDFKRSVIREFEKGEPVGEEILFSYRELSSFSKWLKRYIDEAGDGRIKVILQEQLKAETKAVYMDVLDFLGCEQDGRTGFELVNERRKHKYAALESIIKINWKPLADLIYPLKRLLGISSLGIYKKLMDVNSVKSTETLSPAERSAMRELFSEEVRDLKRLLGVEVIDRYWPEFKE